MERPIQATSRKKPTRVTITNSGLSQLLLSELRFDLLDLLHDLWIRCILLVDLSAGCSTVICLLGGSAAKLEAA